MSETIITQTWPTPPHAGTIRKPGPGDLNVLAAIENQCFSIDRISRSGLRRFLTRSRQDPWGVRFLAVEHGACVCGYILLLLRRNSLIARIYSIAVMPEHRRTGMARTLLAGAESVAVESGRNRIRLEVREDNAAAIRLYTSIGYQTFGRIEPYYEDRTAAIRMEKPL
ncbi:MULTISPECIES: GNAT family N-acetyltransferase [Acidithiobacillus]|uniref:N-acetyltransferase domain-containing protein n=2 Tax=Acidithiobacillus TaxID=119977 RepID=A0A179BLB9_ACIFR|nr:MULTISPECIES: N-acetyltransferase [Acidithiobacillus]MEB8488324.1 N-acetyltransferase [Acidithiobacillus ferriphilus]MEB8490695.1 N-acetyltransferase [Acidithiobacillus ferriphilus]MEB8493545.1 N-acetyltransferase [Acidithiobacillus ferriphilus]MEB8513857.1 N-acetyltransferase [Acidithiobacillus ferriphilus]MEB8521217.1 N-acetyltransferase [Acidithiobacillus ferriphilus]